MSSVHCGSSMRIIKVGSPRSEKTSLQHSADSAKKTFEVKATGEAAVKKHAAGKKHQELEKACKPAIPLSSFVVTKTPSTSSSI